MASSSDAGKFVNDKLDTKVPWGDLLGTSNLQTVVHAIVQRLDRQDATLASVMANGSAPPGGGNSGVTVISNEELQKMRSRLEVLENTTLQNRMDAISKDSPLKAVAAKAKSKFSLGDHVIPLTQMKSRVEGCEVGIKANAHSIDETNEAIAETAKALHEELKKMVTKKEFKVLEDKHNKLAKKVDQMFKDIVERLEKMIKEVKQQVVTLTTRVDTNEEKINKVEEQVDTLQGEIAGIKNRVVAVEEEVVKKADKEEVDAALQEIRDEIAAINIEEVMAMAEKANERIDLMDVRCDKMEDEAADLKDFVMKFQKEMEDMQLERQIENLRRDLQEAKTGIFMKATARMDAMQLETNEIRDLVTSTQGGVQVNRESIQDVEDVVRGLGVDVGSSANTGGTRAMIAALQDDIKLLQNKYSEAMEKEAEGKGQVEETAAAMEELKAKLHELAKAKADKTAVDLALEVKADKDAVAKDVEANQRAVDEALSTMNAGTQGIQQLLDQQGNLVGDINERLGTKLDRAEIEALQERIKSIQGNDSCASDQQDLQYSKYGVSPEDAAGMRRGLQKYNCISCNRPLRPDPQHAKPALPLLPSAKDKGREFAYASANATKRVSQPHPPLTRHLSGDSIVEMRDLQSLRSAGGTQTARLQQSGKLSRTTSNDRLRQQR